ncbi:phosphoserine phosphatase SerB [Paracoccus sp. S-4012]|uniref:phosphoserine phosphatase SerB n=1 Tax=Paracoccus sp. S-4012 TaxID=2665648 RepID=UPI0012B1153F|nr:phosphoserine phosphatase SerB [Paracoccus sp. S-4012]MRX49513.1 phosphoserine phosphatase SerB [Paracoccus sp. S-4012]
MPIVTVLAAPARADLDAARLDRLRAALGGAEARWLAAGIAAEFAVAGAPADFEATRMGQQAEGFDLALLPDAGRRKRLLLADMDSTMIEQECIDELADLAGVGPRVAEITARAMNGELDFEGALIERVGLLAGLPGSVVADVLAGRITLASGGRELVATMRAGGAWTALVSGGFSSFTGPVAEMLGFDEHRANTLTETDGKLHGTVGMPILGREAKLVALHEIAARHGLTPADAIAVGDGANDLPMLMAAGLGVALHAKPSVAAQAQVRLHHADLTGLLYLQGYHADEIVRV